MQPSRAYLSAYFSLYESRFNPQKHSITKLLAKVTKKEPAVRKYFQVRYELSGQLKDPIFSSYVNYDDISSDEFIDDVELVENRTKKVRTSRPPRSVLYYVKAYESWLSLTPIQLPPRSRIIQVGHCNLSGDYT
jgi:hypothetical protein